LRAAATQLGERHAELLGNSAHRLGEGDVLNLLHEAEDVAGGAAAKAVIELARGMHRERRRFFAMEWAKTGEVLSAGALELYVISDDANNVRLLLEGVRKITGIGHYGVLITEYTEDHRSDQHLTRFHTVACGALAFATVQLAPFGSLGSSKLTYDRPRRRERSLAMQHL